LTSGSPFSNTTSLLLKLTFTVFITIQFSESANHPDKYMSGKRPARQFVEVQLEALASDHPCPYF